MNIKIEGLDELNAKLSKMTAESRVMLRPLIQKIALDLKGKAQKKAPVDTGDLRGSAYYKTSVASGDLSAEVGFNSPYATRQHENMQYHHEKGGEAKYLENPLKENSEKYIKMIGDGVMKELEK